MKAKRLLSLLLAVVFLFGLLTVVSCGGDDAAPVPETDGEPTAETDAMATESAPSVEGETTDSTSMESTLTGESEIQQEESRDGDAVESSNIGEGEVTSIATDSSVTGADTTTLSGNGVQATTNNGSQNITVPTTVGGDKTPTTAKFPNATSATAAANGTKPTTTGKPGSVQHTSANRTTVNSNASQNTTEPSGNSSRPTASASVATTVSATTTVKKPITKPSDLIPTTTKPSATSGQQKPADPVETFMLSFTDLVVNVAGCDMKKIKSVALDDGSLLDSYSVTSAMYGSRYCFHIQYVKGKKVIMANVTVGEDGYDVLFTVFSYYICHSLNLNEIDSDVLFTDMADLPTKSNFQTVTVSGYQVSCYLPAEYISFTAAAVGHTVASAADLASKLTEAQCTECFCDPDRSVNFMALTDKGRSLGLTDKILSRALVNAGNQARLAKAMNKAKAGGDLTFAAIGGSVTEGAFASNYSTLSYAGLTNAWFQKTFPNSEVEFVHKGIGGTSSLLGVHRIEEDVLQYNPDIVIIEYAVNDTKNKYQQEAYASLVRRVLEHKSQPAVILLFVMDEIGNNIQELQIPVGEHYDLPMISHADAIWPEVRTNSNPDGQYAWSEIGADYVHPTNMGHAIISELLCSYLQKTYDKLSTISTSVPALPAPYSGYTFQNAVWYNKSNITPKSMGSFVSYTSDGCSWKSNGKQPIVFEVTGKRIFIPTSASKGEDFDVTVRIDGGAPIKLDRESKEFGGGRYINYLVLDEKTAGKHTIEITCNSGTLYLGGLFVS